jgi:hypothetical protein
MHAKTYQRMLHTAFPNRGVKFKQHLVLLVIIAVCQHFEANELATEKRSRLQLSQDLKLLLRGCRVGVSAL